MSKSKQNKKVTSIAIKLNSLFVSKIFSKFLLFDIFLLIIVICYWCIQGEINYYGEFVPNIKRAIKFFPIESATYTVTWVNGKTMVKDASSFLLAIKKILLPTLIFQGILILKEIVFGTSKIRRILKPLDEIAETASRLSNMTFDEDKVQNLEEAISKISPTTSNEKIHTGDLRARGALPAWRGAARKARRNGAPLPAGR